MEDEDYQFAINYDNVIQHKDCLSVTRLLAADLKANPYMTVGMFIKELNDIDLGTLKEIVEPNIKMPKDDEYLDYDIDEKFGVDPKMADIVLIAEMLSRAEGVTSTSDKQLARTTSMFMYYIMFESLYRKGLIKVHHKNMSFSDDSRNRIIVEKL